MAKPSGESRRGLAGVVRGGGTKSLRPPPPLLTQTGSLISARASPAVKCGGKREPWGGAANGRTITGEEGSFTFDKKKGGCGGGQIYKKKSPQKAATALIDRQRRTGLILLCVKMNGLNKRGDKAAERCTQSSAPRLDLRNCGCHVTDAKLSGLIGSKKESGGYCCCCCSLGSPVENSPMINTREPIKKQTLAAKTASRRPSCDAGNTSESNGDTFFFPFPILVLPLARTSAVSPAPRSRGLYRSGGLLLNLARP